MTSTSPLKLKSWFWTELGENVPLAVMMESGVGSRLERLSCQVPLPPLVLPGFDSSTGPNVIGAPRVKTTSVSVTPAAIGAAVRVTGTEGKLMTTFPRVGDKKNEMVGAEPFPTTLASV